VSSEEYRLAACGRCRIQLRFSIPITRSEHADLVVTPHALSTYDVLKKEESQ
jgi:hypothetical protein